jgi:glucose-6-phosphate isomerase
VILRLCSDVPSSESVADEFEQKKVLARLQALDSKARRHGVSKLDPALNELIRIGMETGPSGAVTKSGYGLLHLSWLAEKHREWPRMVLDELASIKAAIKAQHGVPLKFVIWAGVGGLAEDKAMYLACGLLKRGPKQYILDSADPAKLKAILADMKRRAGCLEDALKSTLVVGLAMGMSTYEPIVNLEKIAILYDNFDLDCSPNFIYMAVTGSVLHQFASRRGYRRIELQPDGGNTTTGRHSAPLTRGSLYPLGLAGVPLETWIDATCLSGIQIQTAFRLAAFLHQQGLAGRDKVTVALSPSLAGTALWMKQNFEGSLGKSEQLGLKIVIGEPLRMADYRAPKGPRQDRVFLLAGRKGEPAVDRLKGGTLRRSGYPLASLTFSAEAPLSQYLQFIHYVVFALGWLRQMNFVTQPAVELYQSIANPLYQNSVFQGGIANTAEWRSLQDSPQRLRWRSGVVLHYDHLPCGFQLAGRDAASAYAALLHQLAVAGIVEYGELTFFGDTRYTAAGKKLRRILERAASRLFRDGLKMPADVSEGPAINHTCYEMLAGHGRCLSTLLISELAESIPANGYTADYHRAQFLAAQMALKQQAGIVVSITLRDLTESSLKALDEFFGQVAAQIRKLR